MKKLIFGALRVLITTIILFYLFRIIGIQKISSVLGQINLAWLPAIILLLFVSLAMKMAKTKVLLKTRISTGNIAKATLLSWAAGLFVPGRIGEFSLAYFLKKAGVPLGEATAATIADKAVTFLIITLAGSFALVLYFDFMTAILLTLAAAGIILGAVAIVALPQTRALIRRTFLKKYEKDFSGFSATLFSYFGKMKARLAENMLLTGVYIGSLGLMYFAAFMAFNQQTNLFSVITISSAAIIISAIPITVGGTGVMESSAVFLFSKIGLATDITLAAYLLVTVISYLLGTICILGNMFAFSSKIFK